MGRKPSVLLIPLAKFAGSHDDYEVRNQILAASSTNKILRMLDAPACSSSTGRLPRFFHDLQTSAPWDQLKSLLFASVLLNGQRLGSKQPNVRHVKCVCCHCLISQPPFLFAPEVREATLCDLLVGMCETVAAVTTPMEMPE